MKQSIVLGMALFVSTFVFAADNVAKEKLAEAQTLFADRTDATKVEEAIEVLDEALLEAKDATVVYDVKLFYSKVLYWKGKHVQTDGEKIKIHDQGVELAEEAIEAKDYAEAYYWKAAQLGRWAEAKGVIASLSKKGEMIRTLKMVDRKPLRHQPKGADPKKPVKGEAYQGFGADRILGRLYFKLPGFAGGSTRKAKKHLSKAFKEAPEYPLNVIYYAEVLYSEKSAADKAMAKRILDEMLAKDPANLVPGRGPEAKEEFETARRLRQEMGR